MPPASRFRMTILFVRVCAMIGVVGLILALLGVASFGSLAVPLLAGLILIAIAVLHLPLALLIGGAADATRAIQRSIEDRRLIRARQQDRQAGLLSVSAPEGGELSEPR